MECLSAEQYREDWIEENRKGIRKQLGWQPNLKNEEFCTGQMKEDV